MIKFLPFKVFFLWKTHKNPETLKNTFFHNYTLKHPISNAGGGTRNPYLTARQAGTLTIKLLPH